VYSPRGGFVKRPVTLARQHYFPQARGEGIFEPGTRPLDFCSFRSLVRRPIVRIGYDLSHIRGYRSRGWGRQTIRAPDAESRPGCYCILLTWRMASQRFVNEGLTMGYATAGAVESFRGPFAKRQVTGRRPGRHAEFHRTKITVETFVRHRTCGWHAIGAL